ncbi:MAG: ABC transporter ATP-binding protein [Thiobacillaceae bacterium]|nr:ABC transporter ATP-binding protein [Thiobacillaceae bacterium]MCX7672834.1 ABC transporter ATP-binding protein [Thiobacillaceae bacterium]MDW8323849.1 ABC transporter ATP-binding protein [Burkholderiales bacterium]
MDPIVEIHDLHFAYGQRQVLRGLRMTVPRGRVVAVLGASGSGKSTLLKLIGGEERPDAGRVLVDGQDVHALSTADLYRLRRRIGRMFQESGLFSDLTVFDNVAFPLREHTDLPEEMIRDLVLMKLHAVGLRGTHAMGTGALSGGMSRRVALARAIALDPMLIMYDEPFAGLDPISLNVIAHIIRRLNDALGATSIVVTYDVAESLKIADHVYFLSDGVVVAHGPAAEMPHSRHPFVQQFVQGRPHGPVHFHYPARDLHADFLTVGQSTAR